MTSFQTQRSVVTMTHLEQKDLKPLSTAHRLTMMHSSIQAEEQGAVSTSRLTTFSKTFLVKMMTQVFSNIFTIHMTTTTQMDVCLLSVHKLYLLASFPSPCPALSRTGPDTFSHMNNVTYRAIMQTWACKPQQLRLHARTRVWLFWFEGWQHTKLILCHSSRDSH